MRAAEAKRLADDVLRFPKLLDDIFEMIKESAKGGFYKCTWHFPADAPLSDRDESILYGLTNILNDRFYGYEADTGKNGKAGNIYISWETPKENKYQKGDMDRNVVREQIEKMGWRL